MFQCTFLWLRRGHVGIVGLPNVGKSTLFNALTASQLAKTSNFPFCTIDPNRSKAQLEDARLLRLAAFSGATKVVPAEVDVIDVAGLIEGASEGAGMGNQFLASLRPVTVMLHTVRCFEKPDDGFDIPHPLEDIAVIESELMLADLASLEKRAGKKAAGKGMEQAVAAHLTESLSSGVAVRDALKTFKSTDKPRRAGGRLTSEVEEATKCCAQWQLLTAKPVVLVLNVEEESITGGNAYTKAVEEMFAPRGIPCIRICAALEEELAQLPAEERVEMLNAYGLTAPRTSAVLSASVKALGYQSFFTVGPKMACAWLAPQDCTARRAAEEIHTDLAEFFHRARVAPWDAWSSHGNLAAAEKAMEVVGAEYVMRDGEVLVVEHSGESKSKGG